MSVWKKLSSQDAFLTSYVAKKQFTVSKDDVESIGVKFLPVNRTYTELDCGFKLIASILKLSATVQNCTFALSATRTS